MTVFTKWTKEEGTKTDFRNIKNFYNVGTSSLEKIASNWDFSAKEINDLCILKNPEVIVLFDDDNKGSSISYQCYFVDNLCFALLLAYR